MPGIWPVMKSGSGGGGGGASPNDTFVTTTVNGDLPNEVLIGAIILAPGTLAARPGAGTVATGSLYDTTDTGVIYRSNGTTWDAFIVTQSGALLAANNLSDVANAATSLANLAGAPLASPALTGSPTAPTQATGDNTTKIATDAFVTTAVNNAIAGVNPAIAVQAATNAILPNSPIYNNGASGIGATLTTATTNTALVVDGYTPALNDRILVKNQASAFQNGMYVVTQLAALGLAWILTRALDYDMPSDINNTGAIPAINGTANATTSWVLTSSVATIGTDPLTYTKFTLAPSSIFQVANNLSEGVAATMRTNLGLGAAALLADPITVPHGGTGVVTLTGLVLGNGVSNMSAVAAPSGTVVGTTDTQTLTNKRVTKRVLALSAGSATPAINTDSYDVVHITAQSAAITSFTTNLTGTPVDGDTLRISITDNGTARALTWGASFEASTIILPTTTVISTRLDVGFFWNTETTKWRCVAVA